MTSPHHLSDCCGDGVRQTRESHLAGHRAAMAERKPAGMAKPLMSIS